jgi:hypothetical protein
MMNPPGGKQSALMTPLAAREYSSAGSGQGGGPNRPLNPDLEIKLSFVLLSFSLVY